MKQTLASVTASCTKLDERVDALLATRLRYVARTTELTEKIKEHEEFIEKMRVPDMMDLMVACVEAGLSLDASVQRVGEASRCKKP